MVPFSVPLSSQLLTNVFTFPGIMNCPHSLNKRYGRVLVGVVLYTETDFLVLTSCLTTLMGCSLVIWFTWLLETAKQNAEDSSRFGSFGSDAMSESAVYLCHRATPNSVGI